MIYKNYKIENCDDHMNSKIDVINKIKKIKVAAGGSFIIGLLIVIQSLLVFDSLPDYLKIIVLLPGALATFMCIAGFILLFPLSISKTEDMQLYNDISLIKKYINNPCFRNVFITVNKTLDHKYKINFSGTHIKENGDIENFENEVPGEIKKNVNVNEPFIELYNNYIIIVLPYNIDESYK